jgi:hypothetical protein
MLSMTCASPPLLSFHGVASFRHEWLGPTALARDSVPVRLSERCRGPPARATRWGRKSTDWGVLGSARSPDLHRQLNALRWSVPRGGDGRWRLASRGSGSARRGWCVSSVPCSGRSAPSLCQSWQTGRRSREGARQCFQVGDSPVSAGLARSSANP